MSQSATAAPQVKDGPAPKEALIDPRWPLVNGSGLTTNTNTFISGKNPYTMCTYIRTSK